jgi:hypothetical protein
MDGERFDRMTRGLLAGASRRSLLAGLVGGAAATVAGAELLVAKKGGNGKGRGNGKGKGNGGGGDNDKKRTVCHCPAGDPDNCHTITIGRKAAERHLQNHPGDQAGPCDDDGQDQCLPVTDTEGDVEESHGQFTATTEGAAAFGNLVFDVPEGTTFAELETLGTEFDFETGTCGGGSPRFVVFLENGRCPYAAFPAGGDCADGQGNTGNFVGDDTPFVWNDNLCNGSGNTTSTYSQVLALYGNVEIDNIVLVTDESPVPGVSEKTVTFDPCITVSDDDA